MKKMLAELAELLYQAYGKLLKEVILYGSAARGTHTRDSDIDISYQEYLQWKQILPFYRNVSEEGVVLYAV